MHRLLHIALASLLPLVLQAGTNLPDRQLYNLNPELLKRARLKNTSARISGTPEKPTLRITTAAGKGWPGVGLPAKDGKWDLSAYQYLGLDIRNVDTHSIDLFVRVDNPGANGRQNCMTERVGIQPDQRVTLTIPLRRKNTTLIRLFGMHGYPQGLYAKGGIDPSNIIALTIFTGRTPSDNTVEISNIRAFGEYREPKWASMTPEQFFPFIDRYGQFIHSTWPGKIQSDADFQTRKKEEEELLTKDAGPQSWNKWGGWKNGPQLKSTGAFRTEKHAGRWWLVDPDGRLFFSTGLCCVRPGSPTMVSDRDKWFKDLPKDTTGPLGTYLFKHWTVYSGHYTGRSPMAYDHLKANLERKYGKNWENSYPVLVHRRLRNWGINTIANWSDGRIYGLKKTPYVATFWYKSRKLKGNKAKFPDVFDPGFAKTIEQRVSEWLKSTHDDPWCIGYFVDNEMHWGGDFGIGKLTMESPANQPAKQKLQSWLQTQHADIAALNNAWGTSYKDWSAFMASKRCPSGEAAKKDLISFTTVVAETYYSIIRQIIKKHAPNRLYLGDRSVGGSYNLAKAAAKHCDVISYNRYCSSVKDVRLPKGVDAPVIIGEFHFGGLDRGKFSGGLFSAIDQRDREQKYKTYVQSALANPEIVGVHWFQYVDQPTTGRYDGENAQCGFIDMCDTPYLETTRAARQMGDSMYEIRFKASME